MSGQVQTVLCAISVDITKKIAAGFLLVPANSEAGDATALIADRELSYTLSFQRPELTYSIENPEQRRAEVLFAWLATAFQPFEDRIEILLAPQVRPNRDVHLGMEHIVCFKSFHEAIGYQLIILRGL